MKEVLNINFEKHKISGLNLEVKAIYIDEFLKTSNRNILVISDNYYNSNKLFQKLNLLNQKTFFFPVDDFALINIESINPELQIIRSNTLDKTKEKTANIYVTDLKGLLINTIDPEKYHKLNFKLKVNDKIDVDFLTKNLIELGYIKDSLVVKEGEFSKRGFVFDIYPINFDPVRIEFWGDEITEIRKFDVITQRTIESINEVEIIPVNLKVDTENKFTILDYINNPIIIYDELTKITNEYEELRKEDSFHSFYSPFEVKNGSYLFDNINDSIDENNILNLKVRNVYNVEREYNSYLKKLVNMDKTIFICFKKAYSQSKFLKDKKDYIFKVSSWNDFALNKINLIVYPLESSFENDDYIFISENTLFGKFDENNISQKRKKTGIKNLNALETGDYVVHEKHGIGVYRGLKTLLKNGMSKDYLQIDYKGTDKLYIPVEKIELISKFSNKEGYEPKIHKLGSLDWEKAKNNARKRAKELAIDLLKLYAQRESSQGYSFPLDTEEQMIFESEFSFSETSDQLRAIDEVKKDMEESRPMDRIICGDVGFGKTEVAFRAIFKAVMASKQVMFLCPTTILSRQHYLNAVQRFKTFPVKIAILNRFISKKEQEIILRDFKEGRIDLLIGTHRILSSDVKPKDLGLLVVDEEQRFGVIHKEKIKEFKNNIDILTLSATPIPRTVQMSLSGIKSLSLIETAPTNRIPIQTYVLEEQENIIKTAIYKEISRNGQVFLLSNQVKGIDDKAIFISKLVPEARVCYAHGKMSKNELEDVMLKFTNKDYDVLVSTTIIETGIDIPSANTLIVLDADKFGLSQLYQIRGRVGRANKMAYCFLMYKKGKIISEIAIKRLNAIKEFTELGSGFAIAMRDLSIRGAGDVLGSDQAGFIDTVGVELFIKLLNNEVLKLRGLEVEDESEDNPLIDVATSINNEYVEDEIIKIEIHKKINTINTYEKLLEVKDELSDRFGKISEELEIYMYQEWFEKYSLKLGIRDIRQNNKEIEIILSKEQTNNINGEKLFMDIIRNNKNINFNMKFKRLAIIIPIAKQEKHFVYVLIDIMKAVEKALA